MNTRYQIHSNINSTNTISDTIDVSMHAHNTRLQNRLSNLQENRALNGNITNDFGPAFNTRHTFVNVQPQAEELAVEIDFDEASHEWNKNKRRTGQMYEYISPASPVKKCSSNNRRYNTRSSKQSS